MFDYTKFENDIILEMQGILKKWMQEYDDIYIISLDCSSAMDSIGVIANSKHYLEQQADFGSEDYWYYKYCEEEWELFDHFEEVSRYMKEYLENNKTDMHISDNFNYSQEFEDHSIKVKKACEKALCIFKQVTGKNYPNLLLTFNIREYLDRDDRLNIFKEINSQKDIDEYSEHIDDFA